MPPRTRNNHSPPTRKRQASNVDETANKRPKTGNTNGTQEKNKKKRAGKVKSK